MVSKRRTYTREFKVETVNLPSPGLVDTGLGSKFKIGPVSKAIMEPEQHQAFC